MNLFEAVQVMMSCIKHILFNVKWTVYKDNTVQLIFPILDISFSLKQFDKRIEVMHVINV